MKKNRLPILVFALLLLTLALCLPACGPRGYDRIMSLPEEERAAALFTAEIPALDPQKLSYRLSSVGRLTRTVGSTTTDITVEAENIYAHKGRDFIAYNRAETSLSKTVDGNGTRDTVLLTDGFLDGRMFSTHQRNDGRTETVWSSLSKNEYLAYLAATAPTVDESTLDITAEDCLSLSCRADEEKKTLTLTLDGFKREAKFRFYDTTAAAFSDYLPRGNFDNVKITAVFDENLYPLSYRMDYTFSGANATSYTVEAKFTYGIVELPEQPEFAEADACADLRIIGLARREIAKLKEADAGSFKLEERSTVEMEGRPTTEEQANSAYAFSGAVTGPFTYTLDYSPKLGTHAVTTYENGYRSVLEDGRVSPRLYPQTEEAALADVLSQIDRGGFSSASFSDFTLLNAEEGRYGCSVLIDSFEDYKLAFASAGNLQSVAIDFYLVYRDGKLLSLTYELHATLLVDIDPSFTKNEKKVVSFTSIHTDFTQEGA